MKKQIALGFAALGTAVAVLPLFAAFEAHVINVTARIENALNVPVKYLEFGTVFPQEKLEKPVDIALSQSFLDEDRVDDVEYFIRQKPKCAITWNNGTEYDNSTGPDGTHIYTRTGHVGLGPTDEIVIDCGFPPRDLKPDDPNTSGNEAETWGVLPDLCPYLSKHSEIVSHEPLKYEDGAFPSFHEPWYFSGRQLVWTDVKGYLSKLAQDIKDTWIIDLAVPCFGGYCAQDWASFVHSVNPDAGDPDHWTQPIANEHKIFGCDLWVEVKGISLPGLGCKDKVDVMIVMDNSGSIDAADFATMQSAAKAFVDALLLSPDGPHSGKVSFATGATLDIGLTDDADAVKAAIDLVQTGGLTNLSAGIDTAQTELTGANGRADAPNVMIILTDGAPNVGGGEAGAIASADVSKAAGTEIFAVGIGTDVSTSAFLHDDIVSDPENIHYFDSATFDDLEAILTDLVTCND